MKGKEMQIIILLLTLLFSSGEETSCEAKGCSRPTDAGSRYCQHHHCAGTAKNGAPCKRFAEVKGFCKTHVVNETGTEKASGRSEGMNIYGMVAAVYDRLSKTVMLELIRVILKGADFKAFEKAPVRDEFYELVLGQLRDAYKAHDTKLGRVRAMADVLERVVDAGEAQFPCKCNGSGEFYSNTRFTTNSNGERVYLPAKCYGCGGKGFQTEADMRRNYGYNRHRRS